MYRINKYINSINTYSEIDSKYIFNSTLKKLINTYVSLTIFFDYLTSLNRINIHSNIVFFINKMMAVFWQNYGKSNNLLTTNIFDRTAYSILVYRFASIHMKCALLHYTGCWVFDAITKLTWSLWISRNLKGAKKLWCYQTNSVLYEIDWTN